MSDCDELRAAVRELLDADEAYRRAPTMDNMARLVRARRKAGELAGLETVL